MRIRKQQSGFIGLVVLGVAALALPLVLVAAHHIQNAQADNRSEHQAITQSLSDNMPQRDPSTDGQDASDSGRPDLFPVPSEFPRKSELPCPTLSAPIEEHTSNADRFFISPSIHPCGRLPHHKDLNASGSAFPCPSFPGKLPPQATGAAGIPMITGHLPCPALHPGMDRGDASHSAEASHSASQSGELRPFASQAPISFTNLPQVVQTRISDFFCSFMTLFGKTCSK